MSVVNSASGIMGYHASIADPFHSTAVPKSIFTLYEVGYRNGYGLLVMGWHTKQSWYRDCFDDMQLVT